MIFDEISKLAHKSEHIEHKEQPSGKRNMQLYEHVPETLRYVTTLTGPLLSQTGLPTLTSSLLIQTRSSMLLTG